MSATLPLDWPPLREAAAVAATDVLNGLYIVASNFNIYGPSLIEIHARLLADLTRPASRDFWARWLAEKVGLTLGPTAPGFYLERSESMAVLSVPVWPTELPYMVMLADHETTLVQNWRRQGVKMIMVAGMGEATDPIAALRLALLAVGPHAEVA